MKKCSKTLWILLLCIFVCQLQPENISRAQEQDNNIILLIDNSGSMRQTDPGKLTIAAASMLIDTVSDSTNLNVIGFGEKVIAPYQLNDHPSAGSLKVVLSNFKFDHNFTDLKEGLKEALKQLGKVQGDKSIIVLSDGKEDIAGGVTEEHNAELSDLMEKAYSAGVRVNTIGLSGFADKLSLERMAYKTGGEYFYCDNPADLFNIYSKILGNQNNFYTIENYTSDTKKEKTIKLSSYIDEVVIKVASCENKIPFIDVTQDGREVRSDKAGESYKIYRFNNQQNSEIKISARDQTKNLILVQIRSRVQLNINPVEAGIRVPKNVPVDIYAAVQTEKDAAGIHMDILDGSSRQNINKENGIFKFSFKKDKEGQYPVLATAYDGEGNIVSLKNIIINVTDDPPYYYVNPLPITVISGKPFKIELKQLDNSKVDNPSGEVVVDYGDSRSTFQLKLEEGVLGTEVTLEKTGNAKITASINGISNNESFSYYLPSFNTKVTEKPYVELEVHNLKQAIRKHETINLNLDIKKSLIYVDEKIYVLNSYGKNIGEFQMTPGTKGKINVKVTPDVIGNNLVFTLKPQNDISITEKVYTKINSYSDFDYYFRWFKLPLVLLAFAAFICALVIGLGEYAYKRYIISFRANKEISYSISPGNLEGMVNIELSQSEREKYLNYNSGRITSDMFEDNAIGKFVLNRPKGSSFFQGLKYIFKKRSLFSVEYIPMMDQEASKNDESISGPVDYESDITIYVRIQKRIITITFA